MAKEGVILDANIRNYYFLFGSGNGFVPSLSFEKQNEPQEVRLILTFVGMFNAVCLQKTPRSSFAVQLYCERR